MSHQAAVYTVFVAAMFLDMTVVNVALPAIGHDFAVATTAGAAASITYLVAIAVVVPVATWLGDKAMLLAAVTVFTVASGLCAVAGDSVS